MAGFEENEDLGQGEEADDCDEEVEPVIEMHLAEGEARHTGLGIHADGGEAEAQCRCEGRLGLVGRGHPAKRHEGEREEREILGRSEQQGDLDQLRRQQDQAPGGQEGPDEGRDARERQRFARKTLLGHRVAVENGHHRRLIPGNA